MLNLAELKFVLTKPFRSIEISDNLSFTNETNQFFKNEICKHKSYLEYGSGSSTIFLSKQKNLKVVSVESDYYFANHLKKIIFRTHKKIHFWPQFFKKKFIFANLKKMCKENYSEISKLAS